MSFRRSVAIAAVGYTLFFAAVTANADPTVDPNHPVYDAIEEWRIAGLVGDLPAFRPYPAHELERVLEHVQARGAAGDRERASEYLELLEGRHSVRGWSLGTLFTRDEEFQPKMAFGVGANGSITDFLDYGVTAGIFGIDRGAEPLIPAGERLEEDVLDDNAKVTIGGRDIHTLPHFRSQGTWYSETLSLQAGISRRSFGPFHNESPVISASAPQVTNFVFEWRGERLRFTYGVFSLTTPQWFRERESLDPSENNQIDLDGDTIADFIDKPQNVPGKHLVLHSLNWDVTPWLTLGFFESVLFGPRLELAYFVPFSFLFYAQGTANFADNSFVGLSAELEPAPRWRIPLVLYVDDGDFNDFVRFNFADAKLKATAAGAIQWAPRTPTVRTASLSYEAVLPYMYTHSATNPYSTEPNFLNYLHKGQNLGTGLLPNSDRLRLEADFAAAPNVGIGFRGAFLRHANASEGVDELGQYLNDGGYADSGKSGTFVDFNDDSGNGNDSENSNDVARWIPGKLTYNEGTRFMTQDHIQHTYQVGTDLSVGFATGPLDWDIVAGYTFEYIDGQIEYRWSPDDGPGGGETVSVGDEINHYGKLDVRMSY